MAALNRPDDFQPAERELPAMDVLKQVPAELRAALLAELRRGNEVVQVGPLERSEPGSVCITVRHPFHPLSQNLHGPVQWRYLSDSRHWMQELSQRCGDVEYLVIW
ncbi:MAG: hypothetical protein EOO33_11685 [Comamonadaceae bacterium]|nr:MAG: hypothetical protein EOO33_11685 [Comamonadaceae bacterium]